MDRPAPGAFPAPPIITSRRAVLAGVAIFAGGIAIFLLWRFDPADSRFFPPCPLHAATGLHCPGCGSTRAAHAALHGDFLAALQWNSVAVIALPLLALAGLRNLVQPRRAAVARPRLNWTIALLIIGYGLARNIPVWPFELLAPGGFR